jgi:hypothetical protein
MAVEQQDLGHLRREPADTEGIERSPFASLDVAKQVLAQRGPAAILAIWLPVEILDEIPAPSASSGKNSA